MIMNNIWYRAALFNGHNILPSYINEYQQYYNIFCNNNILIWEKESNTE